MTIIGTIASSTRQGLSSNSYESIQTVTVGAGGAPSVEFTSIPSTYQHLEIRGVARIDQASTNSTNIGVRFNSNSSSYSWHWVYSTGATPLVVAATGNDSWSYLLRCPMDSTQAGAYGPLKMSIMDYSNTNKNTTMRSISGAALDGSADVIWYTGGAWYNTSAVSSILLQPQSGNFKQHTTFALYGIKAGS
jgi:hypothetical protein